MGTEFGNIPLTLKVLLLRREQLKLSAGCGVIFPTGRSAAIDLGDGESLEVRNEAVHLEPFLGCLWQPNQKWFVTGFAACDFDSSGNPVVQTFENVSEGGLVEETAGVLRDQSWMYMDLAIGRWIYRNQCAGWVTGIAPVIELHYTTSMDDANFVETDLTTVGNPRGRMDIFNMTAGLHFQLGERSLLSVACVAPLRSGDDDIFNSEFVIQFNRAF
jgi:hypothetical protein